MASLKQIHSPIVLIADSQGCIGEGDALVTADPGVTVSIRTADCLPVLLVDMHHRVVAAAHAGWRGTVSRVVPKTLERMSKDFGSQPKDMLVAIGPGIGKCCYEVGEEVAREFGLTGRGKIDLAAENARQLVAEGVSAEAISCAGLCTFCDTRFHSWRRDRERAGRMISYIGISA